MQTVEQYLDFVGKLFIEQMPFNQLLGLEIEQFSSTCVRVGFSMEDKLIGNPVQRILHGGVTAAVLDVVGGLVAFAGIAERVIALPESQRAALLAKIGTIDLRVDYLRPGRGKRFIGSGEIIRSGNRVTVCRMELHNDDNIQIAYGTGTYLVG